MNYQDIASKIENKLNLKQSFDIIKRELEFGTKSAFLFFVDGLSKDDMLWYIINKLQTDDNITDVKYLEMTNISYIEVEKTADLDLVIKNVLSGMAAFVVEGIDEILLVDTREYPVRSIEEPDLEKVTRGSRDGFVETIVFNTALLRRRLRDPNLIIEMTEIGSRSKTDVAIVYVNDLVDKEVLKEIKYRIENSSIDSATLGEKTIEQIIVKKNRFNPYPIFRYTERPDVCVSHLLEGHVAIIVDNNPSVLITPITFFTFFQHYEDYNTHPVVGTYLRFIRFVYVFSSLFIVPLWLLIVMYPDRVPEFLSFIGPKEEDYKIPLLLQFLLIEIGLDGLKLASIHTPSSLSTSLGIIGGLLIGEFAVSVGWLIPETILYMAVVAIGQFATPSIEFSYANRISRLFLLVATGVFGIYGFVTSFAILLFVLLTTKTIKRYNYLYPLYPFSLKDVIKIFFRTSKR